MLYITSTGMFHSLCLVSEAVAGVFSMLCSRGSLPELWLDVLAGEPVSGAADPWFSAVTLPQVWLGSWL